jgi:hypothetical protein
VDQVDPGEAVVDELAWESDTLVQGGGGYDIGLLTERGFNTATR